MTWWREYPKYPRGGVTLAELDRVSQDHFLKRDATARRAAVFVNIVFSICVIIVGGTELFKFLGLPIHIGVPGDIELTWVVWGAFAISGYAMLAVCLERILAAYPSQVEKIANPGWAALKAASNDALQRVSYLVIAVVPLIAYVFRYNPLQLPILTGATVPVGLKLSFFASFLFVMGASMATAFSPRRDPEATDRSRAVLRTLCWLCLLNAYWLAIVIAVRAGLLVIGA